MKQYICGIFVEYTAVFRKSEFATTLFQVYFGYILPPGQGYVPNAYQYTLHEFQFPPNRTFFSIHRFYSSFIPLSLLPRTFPPKISRFTGPPSYTAHRSSKKNDSYSARPMLTSSQAHQHRACMLSSSCEPQIWRLLDGFAFKFKA
jgi:hypothetical protein